MKIATSNKSPNFHGLYNNKIALKTLEKISEHPASFGAGVCFASALFLRPFAISHTPNIKEENKKILSAESVSSATTKLLVALLISTPIEKGIKKITNEPQKFLKENTIKNLSKKEFNFITQTIKSASGLISAIPKSCLSVALIPLFADNFFKPKKTQKSGEIHFGSLNKNLAKIIDDENVQKFAKKHANNDKNITRNISALTDTLLVGASTFATIKSDKIEKERKKPLIYNKILSSAISILAGCTIDKMVQKGGNKFLDKFIKANRNDSKLAKYIEGINILRPTLIFATIYYGIIPMLSATGAQKLANKKD